MMPRSLTSLTAAIGLVLAACGGATSPSSAPPASGAAPAASKPAGAAPAASAVASAAASAKPAASASAAAGASAKPAASGSAVAKPTLVPRVETDTSIAPLTKTVIPGTEGKAISADIIDIDQQGHLMVVGDTTSGGDDIGQRRA